jgi:transcriptional regulator of NAD metabolism
LRKIGSELDTIIHCSSFKEGPLMKKTSRIENERRIVSRVKREMDRPRLTESVRNGFSVKAAPTVEKPAIISARA